MNGIPQKPQKEKGGSVIWQALVRMSHGLYHTVGNSFIGRSLTAYRRADAKLHHQRRRALRDDCRPMSPRRASVLSAVRGSGIFRLIATLFSAAAHGPVRFYGQFGLFYSAFGAIIHTLTALISPEVRLNIPLLILYLAMAIVALPLLFAKRSAVELLTKGRLTRWFFVGLLGLPEEQLAHAAAARRHTGLRRITLYAAIVLAAVGACLVFWVHPLVLPTAFLLMCFLSMIVAFPETGIVLSVMTLPLTLWHSVAFGLTAILILVTWVGYGIKLLLMRRSIHFNLLDVFVLLFGATLCLGGLTGPFVTVESILRGILGFLILSLYFLITNLMTSRPQQRRCFVGLGLSLGLVVTMTLIAVIPSGATAWLEGSRAGDAIIEVFSTLQKACRTHLRARDLCILLMAIPFIGGMMVYKKRFLHRAGLLLLLGACGFCLWLWGSFSGLVVAGISLLVFFLLYHHRNLAALILSLPALACGGVWLYAVQRDSINRAILRVFEGAHSRGQIWQGVWQAVCDHPYGIGLGASAFASVMPPYLEAGISGASSLYMTILLKLGVPGLIIFLFVIFLFLQKTFTCLRVCERREDTLMILGGTSALCALLVFGFLSDTPTAMSVMLGACTVLGLCSAYENMILEAWDTTAVGMADSEDRADVIMHCPGA